VDLELVSQKLAALGETVEGIIRADAFVPDSVTAPHFYVGEVRLDYDQTYGGLEDVLFLCVVLTSTTDDKAGQDKLKSFMKRSGPSSVKAALEAGRGEPGELALDGACDDLHVKGVQAHRIYRVGEASYYGAQWTVRVIGTESEEETP
jgi:hypothetical protein